MESKPLLPREMKIIEEAEDCYESLSKFHGHVPEQMSEEEQYYFSEALADYDAATLRAIRANLHNHPFANDRLKILIELWIAMHAALGQKDLLRKSKQGLEIGVWRPYEEAEAQFLIQVDELRERGMGWSAIHRILTARGVIPRTSRQAFITVLSG